MKKAIKISLCAALSLSLCAFTGSMFDATGYAYGINPSEREIVKKIENWAFDHDINGFTFIDAKGKILYCKKSNE